MQLRLLLLFMTKHSSYFFRQSYHPGSCFVLSDEHKPRYNNYQADGLLQRKRHRKYKYSINGGLLSAGSLFMCIKNKTILTLSDAGRTEYNILDTSPGTFTFIWTTYMDVESRKVEIIYKIAWSCS